MGIARTIQADERDNLMKGAHIAMDTLNSFIEPLFAQVME